MALINLLIRNGYRPKLFRRCLRSIQAQSYRKIQVIVCNDSEESEADYIAAKQEFPTLNMRSFVVTPVALAGHAFPWNLYCNDLKEAVTEGWFMYLDNDDYLDNKWCLERLADELTDPTHAVICKFKRGSVSKPSPTYWRKIVLGKIGGSCIVLHHTHKNVAHWDSGRAADFRFISAVAEKLPLKWVRLVVVTAGNKGLKGKLV